MATNIYNSISKIANTIVNDSIAKSNNVDPSTASNVAGVINSMSGGAQAATAKMVSNGSITTFAKHFTKDTLIAMSAMSGSTHAAIKAVLSVNEKSLSALTGFHVMSKLLKTIPVAADRLAFIEFVRNNIEQIDLLSKIKKSMRDSIKIDQATFFNIDRPLFKNVAQLDNAAFVGISAISPIQHAAIKGFEYAEYLMFSMFNTIPSELISIISDYPLTDPIFQNPVFCSNLISLKTANMLAIQSYIADIDASAFNRLANLFNDITQEDIMKIANKINLEAIEGLRDIPVQVSSFALNDLPLIILLENLPRAIINDVFSLSQTVFKDLTAHYVDEGIQQLSSMASNTWRWLDSFTNETIFSTGSTKITKTILTNLIEIDQDILLKYKSNRLAYDPQNYLGALSTSTILELSNQKIYKDLSKLATVTDTLPSVCAAFLNYADRSTISDSIFKNQTTLAELLGVSASLFTGMDWIALKSLCKLSDASLNNIKNTAGAKDALHIVCKYNINMIRTLCANPSSQYLVSSLNIDYEYIIDMLTKPDMASSPTMLMNISPAKDILALDDSLFNDMLTIINNNISHASKISLMSLTNNAKWIAITQFVAIAKFDILKAIADLDSTIYAQIKTITDAQFAGIHNLLEVGAVSLDIKMDSTTHINAVLDVFKLIDPEDIEIYGFIKPSLPMIKDIDKNRLNMLFSITYNVAALLTYNTFITNPSITNAVKYNANLTHIFKALTLIPTNKKPKVFSSYYLMLINKLTLAQIQNMDKNMASIMSTLGVLDMSEVFEDARYGMLNGLTDSEIDSLSEMSESNLNIFKNDIANSIIKIDSSDYSIFSVDNFGSLSKIEVENYPLIVEV